MLDLFDIADRMLLRKQTRRDKEPKMFTTYEALMIAVYTLAVLTYTMLANCEFWWVTFFLSFWIGLAGVFCIMFVATDEVAKPQLPKLITLFSLPIVCHGASHLLSFAGFPRFSSFVYGARYYSLAIPMLYFFVAALWLNGDRRPRPAAFRVKTKNDHGLPPRCG